MPALSVLAHHSEPTDPVLLRWLTDLIETIFGTGPAVYVAVIGVVVLAIPVSVLLLAARARRRQGR